MEFGADDSFVVVVVVVVIDLIISFLKRSLRHLGPFISVYNNSNRMDKKSMKLNPLNLPFKQGPEEQLLSAGENCHSAIHFTGALTI